MREPVDLADWESLPASFEFTIEEVASITRTSYGNIRNAIRAGRLQAYRPAGDGNGPYRIQKRWLEDYRSSCQVRPAPAHREPSPRRAEGGPFKHLDGERLRDAWSRSDD